MPEIVTAFLDCAIIRGRVSGFEAIEAQANKTKTDLPCPFENTAETVLLDTKPNDEAVKKAVNKKLSTACASCGIRKRFVESWFGEND